jgi:hypothetical protein
MPSNESEPPSEKLSAEAWHRIAREAGAHLKAEREYMAQRRKQNPENSQQNLAEALNESDQASRKT